MAKFCGKCGSKLDEYTGICPLCNVKDDRNEDKNELIEYIVTKKDNNVELKEQQISKENLLLKKKKHSIKVLIVVIAVILLAAVTTVILNSIGVIHISPEENMDNEVYRDKMIDALMNHRDEWFISSQKDAGVFTEAYFTDLNFDGKLEFLFVQNNDYYNYYNYSASVYCLDGDNIHLIDCFDPFLNSNNFYPFFAPYYDAINQKKSLLGIAVSKTDSIAKIGEYQLSYQNHQIKIDYYRMCEKPFSNGDIVYYLFDENGEKYVVDEEVWVQADKTKTLTGIEEKHSVLQSNSEINKADLENAYDSYDIFFASEKTEDRDTSIKNFIIQLAEQKDNSVIAPEAEIKATPTVKYYTITFMNLDGSVISTQTVEEGHAAIAPELPETFSEEQFGYEFEYEILGWAADYSNITSNMVIYPEVKPHLKY